MRSDDESAQVQMQFGNRIPLRDGKSLSGILYLPRKLQRPAPALFTMTPYVAQSHHERSQYFAAHGYPCLSVDVRGRGNSEGVFDPRNEAEDGHDIVEWLARQPYCNGKVAMWGSSYLGRCQWATAGQRPPHLATIVPIASPFYSVDVPLRKNIFVPHTIRWLTLISGRASQERIFADQSYWTQHFTRLFTSGTPFRQFDREVGNPHALFQEWLANPHQSAYWDRYEPAAEQYSKISIPVLTVTGAYDGDQLGALEHYRRHLKNASPQAGAHHYLLIGPWDHAGTAAPKKDCARLEIGEASLVDMARLHLDWYAWTMQGGPKPAFLKKNVVFYVAGLEEWRYADSLEQVTERSLPLYLDSSGKATDVFHSGHLRPECRSSACVDYYRYDPRDVGLAEVEAAVDPESVVDSRMLYARTGRELIYHGEPLECATDLAGFFRLRVWLAIDQPDTDFRATVYEVRPDGRSIQLTSDWMRARYRESLRAAKLIETEEPLPYDFEQFPFIARRLDKGSRLRLVIGPLNSIFWQKNYNSGGVVADEALADAREVTVRLFQGTRYPSVLHVPLGQPDLGLANECANA